jgi:hypothetical protein
MKVFASAPQGTGRKAQLTLMTLDQAFDGLDERELNICRVNVGWYEFAVAGVILWRRNLPEDLRNYLDNQRLFDVQLELWKESLGPWCNDVRRYNGVGIWDLKTDAKAAGYIRKLVNLSGRDLKAADFEEEKESMLAWKGCKLYPMAGKAMSARQWFRELQLAINALIKLIEGNLMAKVNKRCLKEWWQTRRKWVPSGSSSNRENLKRHRKLDIRIKASDRPSKMQVTETHDFNELISKLLGSAVCYARASTKPEPGFKRRALYAGDDWSTYIASYASADLEKHISIGGMVAKQTPQDIVEWLAADRLRSYQPQRIWLSLDYGNFNKEHSKQALCMLNLQLAKMWLRHGKYSTDYDIYTEKAWCALWTAVSHLHAFGRIGDGVYTQHFSGLWSGHRDTARDNTMLHWCYSYMIKKAVLQTTGLNCFTVYSGMCGDDEDALHDNWVTMAAYVGMHSVCQLNLNPVKQLADWYCHEFLQRQANKGEFPIRPIAPMIATLSTGSWYKMSRTYYDTVIESLSANCKEIIARGAHPILMRKVIAIMIARMMTVSIGGRNLKLEWWKFRHGARGKQSQELLWFGTGDATPMPQLTIEEHFAQSMPQKALEDWIVAKRYWVKFLQEGECRRYMQEMKEETYKSFYGEWRQQLRDRQALKIYGIRQVEIKPHTIELLANQKILYIEQAMSSQQGRELWREIDQSMAVRRPVTQEVLLDILGLDPRLLQLIGGWPGFFRRARNRDIAKWVRPIEVAEKQLPLKYRMIDPALQSWWHIRHETQETD